MRVAGFGGRVEDLPTIDFETYSEAGFVWNAAAKKWEPPEGSKKKGLPVVGLDVYARHPSTEVLCLCYDLLDGAGVQTWLPWMPPPELLFEHIRRGGLIEAFNVGFELAIWEHVCCARMGWPALPPEQARCAMAKSVAYAMPPNLENAAKVAGQEQKDARGKSLIQKLSIPRNPTKGDPRTRRTMAEDWAEYGADMAGYCAQDVRAEESISAVVPDLPPSELRLWQADQTINRRGVQIDMAAAQDMAAIVRQAIAKYNGELRELTGGAVETASQIQQLAGFLSGRFGITVVSLDEEHVDKLLDRPELPAEARRILEIRQLVGSASIKKLFTLLNQTGPDGRLRYLFRYHAARTGRWAGQGAQPQNLPSAGPAMMECESCSKGYGAHRDSCPHCGAAATLAHEIEWAPECAEAVIEACRSRSLEWVEYLFGNALKAIAGCLRAMFIAAPGHELICADFSAIEGVVLAALAGEEWRLEVFRTHGKIYEMSASKITGIPFEEFERHKRELGTHHPMRKKIGKPAELGSGFGGWITAWKNFGADKFLTDDEIRSGILAWREASPMIVEFWGGQHRGKPWQSVPELHGVEGAFVSAILTPGRTFAFRELSFTMHGDALYLGLPSGRLLTYHRPRLTPDVDRWGRNSWSISFEGWNTNPTNGPIGWIRIFTHGGRLTENIVQAVARDIMAGALLRSEAAGLPVVLHVHDELVCEVPIGSRSAAELERVMSAPLPWSLSWPIKAAGGYSSHRYRK